MVDVPQGRGLSGGFDMVAVSARAQGRATDRHCGLSGARDLDIVITDSQLALRGSSMWRKVRRANISPELRVQFEVFGEDMLADAVGAGELSPREAELDKLLRERRREIVEWLQERRDQRERRERLTCWIVVATLIVALLMRRLPW